MGIILFGRPGLLDLKLSGTENLKLHRAAKAMRQNQMPLLPTALPRLKPIYEIARPIAQCRPKANAIPSFKLPNK